MRLLQMIRARRRVWQRVWLGTVIGAVALVGLCAWPYTVDDAFIVARYAVRLAHGQGYTFNPGPASDGVTGPAWLIPGVVAVSLGLDPVATAKLVGLACAIAAAACVLIRMSRRAQGSALTLLTGLLLLCQPTLGGSAVAGLETGAAALLVVLASLAALRRPAPRPLALGLAVGALAWLRPELAVASSVLLLACVTRVGLGRAWPALALAGMGGASVCSFRLALTGDLLPLAFAAKQGSLWDGFGYCVRAAAVGAGGLGLGLLALGMRLGRSDDRWLGAALTAHVLAVWLAGGDWMPGFRLFAPIVPLYAALAAVGCVRALRWRRAGQALALACLLCACGIPLLDLFTRLPEWRAAGRIRDRARPLVARLHDETRRVALVDIGYLGYASGREVVDLAGITDPEIARLPGGHLSKQVSAGLLLRRQPDALVLHSSSPPLAASDGQLLELRGYPVEMRVARSAWVQREFRVVDVLHYAPNYYYALLLRRPRPAAAQAAQE
jgi:hypothetical protein